MVPYVETNPIQVGQGNALRARSATAWASRRSSDLANSDLAERARTAENSVLQILLGAQ